MKRVVNYNFSYTATFFDGFTNAIKSLRAKMRYNERTRNHRDICIKANNVSTRKTAIVWPLFGGIW